jgi:hypothetical protein
VLRSVTLGVALSVLAAACALAEQPGPPGLYQFAVEVRNNSPRPVEFRVRHSTGGAWGDVIANAVAPTSVPPGISSVGFNLPPDNNWVIEIPGWGHLNALEVVGQPCSAVVFEFGLPDGGWRVGCD